MDLLELSYQHLPDNLKPCFLYFGAFPEDRVIRARKLMSLWIAEGFIPKSHEKRPFEVAEDYLSHLINRNLVILEERSSIGGIKACRVHDLLHDLCLVKIREEKFLQLVHDSDVLDSSMNPIKYEKYRVCIQARWSMFSKTKPDGPFVRSLFVVGDKEGGTPFPWPSTLSNNLRLLNVLDLEWIQLDCEFPEAVTLMVHLRYLTLNSRRSSFIPPSIADLWNLENLVVKGSIFRISLPGTIWVMKNLRHLHIRLQLWVDSFEDHKYGQLERLESLSTIHLDSESSTEELRRRLPWLRKLRCYFRERRPPVGPYKFPELSRLSRLESLWVECYKIVYFGEKKDRYPAFDFPSSLRKLSLGFFNLPWSAISIIGQLPKLEVLKLRSCAFSGTRWDVKDGEFENLKYLKICYLDVEEWGVQDEPFPSLEQLIVVGCQMLGEIPSCFGNIPTLKKIELHECPRAAASARAILEEQKDLGNQDLQVVLYNCD